MEQIERGHFTIARSLLRRIALEHPAERLMRVQDGDIAGEAVADYLDSLPAERVWISDCPQADPVTGACTC